MTKYPIPNTQYPHTLWLPILLCCIGVGLRLLRLEWQPLWWDEGYSVYFATEPLAVMARLTAQDIHPPLYYALLHLWLTGFGSASPLILRAFSVLIGLLSLPALWWMGRLFYPARPRVAVWALLLLAFSPIHIFYSQEVRMYGLEMLLGMVSTGFFWKIVNSELRIANSEWGSARIGSWLGYAAATTALLYTEYYAVLLPFSQGLWALWHFRRQLRRILPLVAAWIGVALAYLPWLLYALPKLIPYVGQKIVEDADRPLGLAAYGLRHLTAFTVGHIQSDLPWLANTHWLALFALLLIPIIRFSTNRHTPIPNPQSPIPSSQSLLPSLIFFPFAVGFLLNLRLPFFPVGGERVLLFVLPYFLLLLALWLDDLMQARLLWARGTVAFGLIGLLLGAGVVVWNFYTVPRYTDDDYRPLIRQAVQQGSDTDTVLAVFPWQVGYWRAYAPVWGRGQLYGPWPLLTPSTAWDRSVQAAIDNALAQGKLWFPAHLSLGGILEGQVEAYLRSTTPSFDGKATINFENRWYSTTTRLSGWARADRPTEAGPAADFSALQLRSVGMGAGVVPSANAVLAVELGWGEVPTQPLRVTLRLEDDENRIWAQRDYSPLGGWPPTGATAGLDRVGLLIPPAVPRGDYRLTVGVGPAADDWLYPVSVPWGMSDVAEIGRVQIAAPATLLPILRLPMQIVLDEPVRREGIDFLGVSGFDPAVATLAGAQMNLSLFVQTDQPQSTPWKLYVSLLDSNGGGAAGWEGWPLPDYPMASWPPGTQTRLPVSFYLPATLAPGEYRLVAGLRDPASGAKSVPVALGTLPIVRRAASFASPQPQHPLIQPALFGSHATLLGYDSALASDGSLELTLYWRAEQTLLPPHNVFVHLSDGTNTLLAQDDGVPGRKQTAAPSNTWTPGEVIPDPHTLSLPAGPGTVAQIGLYDPVSGVRLPVNVNGEIVGDTYLIRLDAP